MTWLAVDALPDGKLHVTYLDVGDGDATLIETPAGQQVLINGGPSPAKIVAGLGRRMPFWDRALELVVLTDAQEERLAGLIAVLERLNLTMLGNGTAGCHLIRHAVGRPHRCDNSSSLVQKGPQGGECKMNALRDVDALLFDLGGVVIGVDFDRAFAVWATYSGEPIDTIKSRFTMDRPYERYERGEINTTEYFASLRALLGINLSDAELSEGWTGIYTGEVPGIADLLRRLGSRIPIYAFTNSNPAHQQAWEREYAEVLIHFRKVFVSSTIGKRKPEAGAFREIASEIGVVLGRILFFDDSIENVMGARAAGMQAVQVRSARDVEDAVARLTV